MLLDVPFNWSFIVSCRLQTIVIFLEFVVRFVDKFKKESRFEFLTLITKEQNFIKQKNNDKIFQ